MPHDAHSIRKLPRFLDLALRKEIDIDATVDDYLPRGRYTHELPLMCATGGVADDDLVSLSHDVLHRRLRVREGSSVGQEKGLHGLAVHVRPSCKIVSHEIS